MSAMIRMLFPLVGYFCTATIITLSAGYGYLHFTGKLNDERVFQIVALLHDINLDEIADTYAKAEPEVPLEELSYEQRQEYLQVATLHLQAKQDQLNRQLSEFDSRFNQLNVENSRYKAFKEDVESYLRQKEKEALDSGLVAVRSQLQNLVARKQAKPLLMKMIKDDRTQQVITLLNGMPTKQRTDILKTFDTVEDIEMLFRIQERMLAGDPVKPFIDEKLRELNELKQLDN